MTKRVLCSSTSWRVNNMPRLTKCDIAVAKLLGCNGWHGPRGINVLSHALPRSYWPTSGATRTGVLYANSQYDLLTPRRQNAVDALIMSRLYPRLSFEVTFLQDLFVTYIDSLGFRCITSSSLLQTKLWSHGFLPARQKPTGNRGDWLFLNLSCFGG